VDSFLPEHLTDGSLHGGAHVAADGERLDVTTPGARWAYALSYRSGPSLIAADGAVLRNVRIVFDLSVTHGCIGMGWTNADGSAFLRERQIDAPRSRPNLVLMAGERIGRLVFRNVAESGEPSTFTIHGASVEDLDARGHWYPVAVAARAFAEEPAPADGATSKVFDTDAALAINEARLGWLRESGLPIHGARVLDVGCGVGHFIPFYLEQGCTVVAIDGRADNIEELRRRHPQVDARVGDVQRVDPREYGEFDVIHCFGLLYHLDSPVTALRSFAAMCRGLLVMETMVCDSSRPVSVLVDETKAASQALAGLGSRPSPAFLALALNRAGFSHVYGAAAPPRHPDFQFEWLDDLETVRNGAPFRCVLVASRTDLDQPALVPLIEA
jgi:SAM-dependent methyltransferase